MDKALDQTINRFGKAMTSAKSQTDKAIYKTMHAILVDAKKTKSAKPTPVILARLTRNFGVLYELIQNKPDLKVYELRIRKIMKDLVCEIDLIELGLV